MEAGVPAQKMRPCLSALGPLQPRQRIGQEAIAGGVLVAILRIDARQELQGSPRRVKHVFLALGALTSQIEHLAVRHFDALRPIGLLAAHIVEDQWRNSQESERDDPAADAERRPRGSPVLPPTVVLRGDARAFSLVETIGSLP